MGNVFSGRYKSLLIDGSGTGYLKSACDYVHLNPVRAGLLNAEDRLMAYPWSSFGLYPAKAERILREELDRLGWDAGQLRLARKNDPQKLAIAARLRRETTLSLKAIAARVGLGQFQKCKRDIASADGAVKRECARCRPVVRM